MLRRTSTLAERIASIERDVANAAKAHGDKALADSERGLRKIAKELDGAAIGLKDAAGYVEHQDIQQRLGAFASVLSGARAGTV